MAVPPGFAAGLTALLWPDDDSMNGWAVVGLANVLLQSATFTGVEALRFAMAIAAAHRCDSMAGLWGSATCCSASTRSSWRSRCWVLRAGAGAGIMTDGHPWLGLTSATLLFGSASINPYNGAGGNRTPIIGLLGWLGWAAWIAVYGVVLLRA